MHVHLHVQLQFFVSVPCARLSFGWTFRQLLSARKYIVFVSYLIVPALTHCPCRIQLRRRSSKIFNFLPRLLKFFCVLSDFEATLKATFAVRNLSNSHTSRNVVCTTYDVFTNKSASGRGL